MPVTIKNDGSIDPSTVPIIRNGTVYTLTGNIDGYELHIECPSIVFDGVGYLITGTGGSGAGGGSGPGIILTATAAGVTIKNVRIKWFSFGISIYSSDNVISGNDIGYVYNDCIHLWTGDHNNITKKTLLGEEHRANYMTGGIYISLNSSFNNVVGNTFINNCKAISLESGNNTFFRNNFVDNDETVKIFKNGGDVTSNSFTGNYWSGYTGTDVDDDGVGDTPYAVYESVSDFSPLMEPFDTASVTDEQLVILPTPFPTPSTSAATSSPSTDVNASPSVSEQQATSSPQPQPTTFPAEIIYAAVATAATTAIAAATVALFFRKKQQSN